MTIDARTLLLATALVALLLAFIVLTLKRGLSSGVQGLQTWAYANFTLAIATICVALGDRAPTWMPQVAGNALTIAALGLYLMALRAFDGHRAHVTWACIAGGGVALILGYYTYVNDSPVGRAVPVMLFIGAICLAAAVSVLGTLPASVNRTLTGICFAGLAVTAYVRLYFVLAGGDPGGGLFEGAPRAELFLTAAAVLYVMMSVGFLLMVTDRVQEKLNYLATHDNLTGSLSRGAILALGVRELLRARRTKAPTAVILADIDHFKSINDRYGHATGDATLRLFARLAGGMLRRTDVFGRYGGEEFVAILPDTDAVTAATIAERIRRAVEECQIESPAGPIHFCVSLGVAATHAGIRPIDSVVASADAALYQAKAAGRNRVIQSSESDEAPLPMPLREAPA